MFSNIFNTYESVTPPKLMAPDYEEDYAQFSDSDNMSFDELFKNITKKTSKVDKSITGEITEFKVPKASDETEDTYDYFQPSTTSNLISSIISSGRSLLGKKYLYGGTNPETGLDCSAFLQYIFKQNGINIPRDTSGIFKIGKEVSYKDIQPGDIICSRGSGQSGRHVLMVSEVSNGQVYVIEAKGKKWGIVEGLLEKKPSDIISIRRVIPSDNDNPFTRHQGIRTPASKGEKAWLTYYSQLTDPDAAKYKNVLYKLTSIESGFNPRANNSNKAFGYTQMYESGTTHNITYYAKTGIANFLNNPLLLLSSSIKLMRANDKQLTPSIISKGYSKGLSIDDMRAIMWFSGLGGLESYLNNKNKSDGSTTTSEYLYKFRNVRSIT